MSVVTLLPFAAAEITGGIGNCLDLLFNKDFSNIKDHKIALLEAIKCATFPEISGKNHEELEIWFNGYISTILQRDVRTLAELEKISQLPNLLRSLATRAGGLLNDADLARDIAMNPVTTKFYRKILQMMFLIFDIQPWFRNINKRLVKSPKCYLIDTLLLCFMLGYTLENLYQKRDSLFGRLVENFVACELLKLNAFAKMQVQLLHFRTSDGKEVDFVLERNDGKIVGIEVKSAEIVSTSDFKGLNELAKNMPNDFICGVVLYAGNKVIPFGNQLWAVPFSILWQ